MSDVKPLAMRADDEGTLTVAVGCDPSGQIVIDFGKPVHWVAMPREVAQEFALNILRRACDHVVTLETPDQPRKQ
jgi:hypothetical protein